MSFEIKNNILIKYIPDEDETEVIIPDGIAVIGDKAFYCCKKLNSITIPNSVTSIGERAFFVAQA